MEYYIENGETFSTLRLNLKHGESFRAEAGAMLSMSPTINLEAKASGKGIIGTFKAAVGGESFFASLFTAEKGDGEVILAPNVLGSIIKIDLNNTKLFAQGSAYLAGSSDLTISTKGSFKSMISGEGLFLQTIQGNGIVFLSSFGAIIEKTLLPGESYIVDTGHIVAFDDTIKYFIRKASKGLFSSLATGEVLVCEYTGPGKIWIQSRNLSAFASLISRFIPTK